MKKYNSSLFGPPCILRRLKSTFNG